MMDIAVKYKIVEKIIQSNDDNFWENLPEDVNQAIKKAKEELDRGNGIPHAQVMTDIKEHYVNK